jgi:hypothetical protein
MYCIADCCKLIGMLACTTKLFMRVYQHYVLLRLLFGHREKQLKLWSDVVLGYHKARQEYSIAWRDWPLWENK